MNTLHNNSNDHAGALQTSGRQASYRWVSRALAIAFAAVTLQAQPAHWVSGPTIPANATVGGFENGQRLYVCHAVYAGGVHPGKIVAGNCNIGYGGNEVVIPHFKIMTVAGTWKAPQPGFAGAFVAGRENGSPLYLCRGRYNGGVHPGKVVAGNCNIGWGGAEVLLSGFDLFYAAPAVVSLEAGPIWSTADAQGKCPAVCQRNNAKWNGDWRTTVEGRMSTCDCVAP
jgi:hypothetical protein